MRKDIKEAREGMLLETEQREKGKRARVGDWRMLSIQDYYSLARDYPRETFDFCWITEIREACFRKIGDSRVGNDELAAWAEEKIKELLVETSDRNLTEKMLNWYVFYSTEERAVRAINFALSLLDLFDDRLPGRLDFVEKVVTKILTGRLRVSDQNLYRQLFSLPKTLDRMLQKLHPPFYRANNPPSDVYYDEEWSCVERALRIIVAHKDYSFLPKIGNLITLLQDGKIKPQDKLFYALESHLAILKQATRILFEAQRKGLAGE